MREIGYEKLLDEICKGGLFQPGDLSVRVALEAWERPNEDATAMVVSKGDRCVVVIEGRSDFVKPIADVAAIQAASLKRLRDL